MNIAFIQSGAFLRSSNKTNPFFDPIIRCVEGEKWDWSICMPKGEKSGYPSERVRYYGAIIFWQTCFWRMVHILMPWLPAWKVYCMFGKLARPFLREWAKADVIVTITGMFAEVLAGAFPDKRIVDIQHGVIYSKHRGYFNKDGGLISEYCKSKNREFWLYGQGYADCFFKNPENHKWLDGRVKVIGDVVRAGAKVESVEKVEKMERKLVVIASQMTTDFDAKTLARMKVIYERFMDGVQGAEGVCVVFRHHPRFGDAIDLGDWAARYDWVDFNDKRPWDEVYAEALCVATINSTCAFDAAALGVPTVLLDGASLGWGNLMVEEYNYPLKDLGVRELLALSEKDLSAIHSNLAKWYNAYYAPFSPERCLKLLKGEI